MPETVDFKDPALPPGMKSRGWNAQLCLVTPDAAGLLLFEKIVKVVHRAAPQAAIAFNTQPPDTADAAARWVKA